MWSKPMPVLYERLFVAEAFNDQHQWHVHLNKEESSSNSNALTYMRDNMEVIGAKKMIGWI